MKNSRPLCLISASALVISGILSGCSPKDETVSIPFTEITWEDNLDDIKAVEGEDYETYDSVYNGTTYVYPKNYDGLAGTVKYSFNDKDELMSIAWQYSTADTEQLESVYNDLHQDLEETYGESGYRSDQATNQGDVWYLESGDIILSAVTTDTTQVLACSYLHPDVSNEEEH